MTKSEVFKMANSVNSFKSIDQLFAQVFNEAEEQFNSQIGIRYRDEMHQPVNVAPKKRSMRQRMKTQINFNIRKFTKHRLVGDGVKAVTKRKFDINPEV